MLVASLGIGRTSEQNLNENNSMREAKEKKKKTTTKKKEMILQQLHLMVMCLLFVLVVPKSHAQTQSHVQAYKTKKNKTKYFGTDLFRRIGNFYFGITTIYINY